MNSLLTSELPRERLIELGSEALKLEELLAVLLGSGNGEISVFTLAKQIVLRFSTPKRLAEATLSELLEVPGLGMAKAVRIQAALGIAKRLQQEESRVPKKITSSKDAYLILKEMIQDEGREFFVALFLNVSGEVIAKEVISIGTLTESLVHPRELFFRAIRHKAYSVVVAHNHPSGSLEPSAADLMITRQLVQAGALLNIPLLDHLIIASGSYSSVMK